MSTTTQKLKYLWTACFYDATTIKQPEDDKYSKHVEGAEHNPSAFRDILDKEKDSALKLFELADILLVLYKGYFTVKGYGDISLEETPLTDRKLIYFREIHKQWIGGVEQEAYINRYCFGYEGKDADGKVHKKVLWLT